IGLPVPRLLEIAIDNELECTPPFNYQIPWPTEPYKEFEHAVNAKKITDFLVRFRDGLGLEMLLLLRRDIGIPDKKDFMLAFRECVEQKRVKEIRPANTMFKYGPEYRKWVVVKIKKIKEIDY